MTERNITVGGDVLQSVLVTGDRVQVTGGTAEPGREAEPPAFRALTLIARPLDSGELPDIAEARALAEGLARVRAPVYLGFVRPPTPEALRARLQEEWDIFHPGDGCRCGHRLHRGRLHRDDSGLPAPPLRCVGRRADDPGGL
jgi:hypothetical protein